MMTYDKTSRRDDHGTERAGRRADTVRTMAVIYAVILATAAFVLSLIAISDARVASATAYARVIQTPKAPGERELVRPTELWV